MLEDYYLEFFENCIIEDVFGFIDEIFFEEIF